MAAGPVLAQAALEATEAVGPVLAQVTLEAAEAVAAGPVLAQAALEATEVVGPVLAQVALEAAADWVARISAHPDLIEQEIQMDLGQERAVEAVLQAVQGAGQPPPARKAP